VTTRLAWANVTHNKLRTVTALGGVCFAILLVFMQLGFYGSCKTSATLLHELLDFDLALVSPHYVALWQPSSFSHRRLHQVEGAADVEKAVGLHIGIVNWRNRETREWVRTLVFGVEPEDRPFLLPEINAELHLLRPNDTAIIDRLSHETIGPHEPGTITEVEQRTIRVVADYSWGTGFNALALMLVNVRTFVALGAGADTSAVQFGLLQLAPGADPEAVKSRLLSTLPKDVQVRTRSELLRQERHHWLNEKPIGLMFTSGVLVAVLVGTVILYQLLSSDVTKHMQEYATLAAIGYRPRLIQSVVIQQGFLFALLGFFPAAGMAVVIYRFIREATHLPVEMTAQRMVFVLLLSVTMCTVSGLLVIRRATATDPADLF
jgi:putative ABC transport system permease protein